MKRSFQQRSSANVRPPEEIAKQRTKPRSGKGSFSPIHELSASVSTLQEALGIERGILSGAHRRHEAWLDRPCAWHDGGRGVVVGQSCGYRSWAPIFLFVPTLQRLKCPPLV
eukprot:5397435-Pleurochrysis_carterae.AAC.3